MNLPGAAAGRRNAYVQKRVGLRMANRGEPMVLRRVAKLSGPEPFTNPPAVAPDLAVTGWTTSGGTQITLTAASAIGRLVAGDVIVDAARVAWSVTADTAADGTRFVNVPVSTPASPPPAPSLGAAALVFAADVAVNGNVMSLAKQIAMGWTESDSIGVRLAAWNGAVVSEPAVDDLLIVRGRVRAILAVSPRFSNGIDFLFDVQAK